MSDKLQGVFTAIVTPFKKDGSIDFDRFKELIEYNIKGGVTGIVPCGTTGESPTLSEQEHKQVVEETVKAVNGRVKVVAGAGSNSTSTAMMLAKHAEGAGVDAVMIVNPYYNKPTQEGLYRHFKAVADAVKIPMVVYNIQGRTGVNVETPTLVRLIKDCSNIIAVKEASGNISQMKDVIAQKPDYFSVLSGDDGIALDLIKEGGDGVISVASNFIPDKMSKMVKAALDGYMEEAKKLDAGLQPFFEAEFIETNPIPIKLALALKGMIEEEYRLPMCEMSEENKEKFKKTLVEMELL
ncbi:4-hydroxy-tetrahydrodipicolinate synthase [Candidatus Woesearchaeota archaeon]|nr:4-hydroxy-tetrahydrodipicolinate synthase [Candidatus Woesearchaeota archaeon]